jgi:aspartyl/asparaginyl beta-hydroxylase (cupin superfamily)
MIIPKGHYVSAAKMLGSAVGAGVADLGRLLLGHFRRYRTARLQDLATATLRDPARRWVVPVLNLTIRARQRIVLAARLYPRWLRSAARYRFSDRSIQHPAARLTLLCPTRGRPGGLHRLLRSVHRTAVHAGRIDVQCYVDADDPALPAYQSLVARAAWRYPRLGGCELHVGAPVGVPATWNALATTATGDFLLMANDDQVYVDHGWDVALDRRVAALFDAHPDRVLCLYFDAGQYPDGGCDFPIISRSWYRDLGYYCPELFQQWQAEQWIFDIARRLGRLFPIHGILVAHLHYQDFTAPFDATYQRHRLTTEKSFADQALFLRTAGERQREADRLSNAIARQTVEQRAPAPSSCRAPDGGVTVTEADIDTETVERYRLSAIRRHYGSVIDAWNYCGHTNRAQECAELAVRQGVWSNPLQRPKEQVAGLPATPVHDPAGFGFISYLEKHYVDFRAEIEQVLDTPIDPVRHTVDDGGLIRIGAWKQAHLFRDGRWQEDVCAYFPVTKRILAEVPELTTFNPGVITVSRVEPGSHIMPHCGPTNALLRIHLPIKVPLGVSIRVAGQWQTWQEGQCLIFDDSFEHEVRHDGTEDRVVLIMDTLHPQLGGDHSIRLQQHQLVTEEQIVAYLRDGGYAGVEATDATNGDILIQPEQATADLMARYLTAAGVEGAELTSDDLRGQRAEEMAVRDGGTPGTRGYIEQVVRNGFSDLFDAWQLGGADDRARECTELAVRQGIWEHPLQHDRDHLRGLTAKPLHDPADFWFVPHLEERYPEIRAEFQRALDAPSGPIERMLEKRRLVNRGSWWQACLRRDGQWQEEICAYFPVTYGVLAEIPEVTTWSSGTIMISRLAASTHTVTRCGPTNACLRIELGVVVPEGISIRVADQTTTWVAGRCLVFDDSFEHQVLHDGVGDAVVLSMDMAHPELSTVHPELLRADQRSPRERIVAFLREHGLAQVALRDGKVMCTPDAQTRQLVLRYMATAGVIGAERSGDEVRWLRAPGRQALGRAGERD